MCAFWLNSRLIEYSVVPGRHLGIAHRHRADALRGGDVPLEQQRRRLQRRRDVVEAEVGAVARQQLGDVDVEREQIANRVAVFGAVQTVDHVAARACCAPAHARSSDAASQRREADVLGFGRVRHALRRHGAHAQLAQHALPGLGVRPAGRRGWPSRD